MPETGLPQNRPSWCRFEGQLHANIAWHLGATNHPKSGSQTTVIIPLQVAVAQVSDSILVREECLGDTVGGTMVIMPSLQVGRLHAQRARAAQGGGNPAQRPLHTPRCPNRMSMFAKSQVW